MEKYKYYTNFYKIVLLVLDIFLINIAFTGGYLLRFDKFDMDSFYRFFFLIFVLIWWIVSGLTSSNKLNGHTSYKEVFINMMYAWFLHGAVALGCIVAFKLFDVPRLFMGYTFAFSFVLTLGARWAIILIYKYYKNLDLAYSKYVIVGANPAGEALYNFFESHKSMGNKFMGFFDEAPASDGQLNNLPVRGSLEDLKRYCARENINEIFYAMPLHRKDVMDELVRFSDDNFISFKMVPEFAGLTQRDVHLTFYEDIPVLSLRREPLEIIFNKLLKRSFDIAFSATFLLTIFPIAYLAIAAAIKLTSPGPVFFKQMRPGRRNQLFACYKFRSMSVNTNSEMQASKNDSRITKVGAFLRKTSLDELPQFINVLIGDMSIVGPRPNLVSQLEHYSKTIELYKIRHFVTPGITGYAQVNGFRGETREEGAMAKRIEFDVAYIQNWSFVLDLKIIWLTVWNIVKGEKNAY
jgi:putative colanic acid biosysnthesis UDP-glucose lipid carrier transferase